MDKKGLKEIAPGLYVKEDTPKRTPISREFIEMLTKDSESETFKSILNGLAEDSELAKSGDP